MVSRKSARVFARQLSPIPIFYRAALVALAACVTACTSVVVLLILWTRPIHGDFCRAAIYAVAVPRAGEPSPHLATGIIPYTGYIYSHWSGRWAGVGLETILLNTSPLPSAYPWLVLILAIAQCLLLCLAVWELIVDIRWALYFSALIGLVYWAGMPSIQQGIFWVVGAVESQLPLTVMSLIFALVLSQRPTDRKQPTLRIMKIAVAALGFLAPALHELAGIILVLALSLVIATTFALKSPLRKMWVIAWVASIVGFLVVFFAPGNA